MALLVRGWPRLTGVAVARATVPLRLQVAASSTTADQDSDKEDTDYLSAFRTVLARNTAHMWVASPAGAAKAFLARIDVSSIDSNVPCSEDNWAVRVPKSVKGEADWILAGVYDGHSGHQAAVFAQCTLLDLMLHKLNSCKATGAEARKKATQSAVHDSFLLTDRLYLDVAIPMHQMANSIGRDKKKQGRTMEPYVYHHWLTAGACTVTAVIDPLNAVAALANAGDCRAVIGRAVREQPEAATVVIKGVAITTDHTARLQSEVDRISAEHPNEKGVICDGRIAGLQPTRGIGDGGFKRADIARHTQYYRDDWNPPYMTAEPDIHHVALSPPAQPGDEGDLCLILGTDGLWERLDVDEAVQLACGVEQGQNAATKLIMHAVTKYLPEDIAKMEGDMEQKMAKLWSQRDDMRRDKYDDTTAMVIRFFPRPEDGALPADGASDGRLISGYRSAVAAPLGTSDPPIDVDDEKQHEKRRR